LLDRTTFIHNFDIDLNTTMEDLSKFKKLLKEIMSQEPKPTLSEEEIHFEELAIGVLELVGEKYVVWLN
jgi:hypothetical protein